MLKGIILAGGTGSRLFPLTKVTNKHLLPVYDRPMIFYPLEALVEAGIEDIMIVTGGQAAGEFLRLLGNGQEFGLKHVNYAYQQGAGGIAAALGLCRFFAGDDPVCVILGDNIFQDSLRGHVDAFKADPTGARVLLKEVGRPERFGVAEMQGERIVRIWEKPQKPPSNRAVTGIYMYDAQVWKIIEQLEPSRRGELEISDVNNAYIDRGQLKYSVLNGWWTDAGTIESLHRANCLVARDKGAEADLSLAGDAGS